MSDLYNDFDPGAAAWLRELIAGSHIPPGTVDDRSILDVRATELLGHRRVHLFAGIGGWAEALRLAAWPDAIPVWTGSPPCQPFSAAGKRAGRDDARHLGPAFVDLVRAARPPVLFGEQVASADVFGHAAKAGKRDRGGAPAWAWCDDLFLRLEAAGYAAWALDIPAAGIGAPHIRQRCFFAAVDLRFADGRMENPELSTGARQRRDGGEGLRQQETMRLAGASLDDGLDPAGGDAGLLQRDTAVGLEHGAGDGRQQRRAEPVGRGIASGRGACGLADADRGECHGVADGEGRQRDGTQAGRVQGDREPAACGEYGWLANTTGARGRGGQPMEGWRHDQSGRPDQVQPYGRCGASSGHTSPTDGFWRDADWLFCRDGKWRPAQPGIQPLAHGVSGRVGLLRGAGNAIVPQAAAEAIAIARDTLIDTGIWAALCREYAA